MPLRESAVFTPTRAWSLYTERTLIKQLCNENSVSKSFIVCYCLCFYETDYSRCAAGNKTHKRELKFNFEFPPSLFLCARLFANFNRWHFICNHHYFCDLLQCYVFEYRQGCCIKRYTIQPRHIPNFLSLSTSELSVSCVCVRKKRIKRQFRGMSRENRRVVLNFIYLFAVNKRGRTSQTLLGARIRNRTHDCASVCTLWVQCERKTFSITLRVRSSHSLARINACANGNGEKSEEETFKLKCTEWNVCTTIRMLHSINFCYNLRFVLTNWR